MSQTPNFNDLGNIAPVCQPQYEKGAIPRSWIVRNLFCNGKSEEIFFSGNFVTLFQTLFQKLQIQVHVRFNKQTQNFIAYH